MTPMTTPNPPARYGPRGFLAALAAIAIVETATWVWLRFRLAALSLFGIATALGVPAGFFMSQTVCGKSTQIGRGMLIAYLATPLTIAVTVIPTLVITQVLHLA